MQLIWTATFSFVATTGAIAMGLKSVAISFATLFSATVGNESDIMENARTCHDLWIFAMIFPIARG